MSVNEILMAFAAFVYAAIGGWFGHDLSTSPSVKNASRALHISAVVVMALFWPYHFARALWTIRHEIATAYGRRR